MAQRGRGDIGGEAVYFTFNRKTGNGKIKQRFGDGYVDKHGGMTHKKGLIDETVAVPTEVVVEVLRQTDGLFHKTA